jgi:hypothetical protein
MLGSRKVFVDSFCEVKDFTKDFQDEEFYDFSQVKIVPGAVYIISRQQFSVHAALIKQLTELKNIIPVLANPAEGSQTMLHQINGLGILDLVQRGKILIISGGNMQSDVPHLYYENFLPKILDYTENTQAAAEYKKQWSIKRPYKFLFLNGRARSHRRLLMHRLKHLLSQAIWTNLDNTHGEPIKLLDSKYEFAFYKNNTNITGSGFIKNTLFNNDWGEIYLYAPPYIDTYFSLVTETVFDYPYSFRTGKIWKPITMGHPFIVASGAGYYRDLHQLGFRSFGNLIDESFDSIDNNQDRVERIAQVVEDLCQQDLASFVKECYNTCKYNQQLLAELSPKIRAEFPNRLKKYINERP